MKIKSWKRFRKYVAVFLGICICALALSDNLISFFLGFFAGFHGVDYEYAKQNYAEISRIIGWTTIVVLVLIFIYMLGAVEKAKQSRELQEERNLQLYAGIAHDLKTPMTMIMGYAKLLEDGKDIPAEDKVLYAKTIIEQTQHANDLLDALLAYTKLQNRSYELKLQKGNLAECLRSCVATCYPALEEAGMEPELLIPEFPVEACFDEMEMKRVFTNLLMNMVKHNPTGTAGIIQMEMGEGSIRMIFADNGSKIDSELQKKLFTPFAVGDSSRNTRNGNGLGLSISKKIMERHKGEIYYADGWKEEYKAFIIELKSTGK